MTSGNHNAEENYGIIDWFKKGIRNYANFSGRARRQEYWYFLLVQTGLMLLAMIVDAVVFDSGVGLFYVLLALGLFIPNLSVTARRLHDTSRSAWWILISLIPLLGLLLIVFLASDTKPEVNQWGPPAK